MRKTGLLNTAIIKEISAIGHTQYLIIGDAGLPIPKDTLLIDLALKSGVPSFLETAEAVLDEMVVEHCYLADEIKEKNKKLNTEIGKLTENIACDYIMHEELKKMSEIRSGDYTDRRDLSVCQYCSCGRRQFLKLRR